jgi:hypothetical protein
MDDSLDFCVTPDARRNWTPFTRMAIPARSKIAADYKNEAIFPD